MDGGTARATTKFYMPRVQSGWRSRDRAATSREATGYCTVWLYGTNKIPRPRRPSGALLASSFEFLPLRSPTGGPLPYRVRLVIIASLYQLIYCVATHVISSLLFSCPILHHSSFCLAASKHERVWHAFSKAPYSSRCCKLTMCMCQTNLGRSRGVL
jgi:hypothetical protein